MLPYKTIIFIVCIGIFQSALAEEPSAPPNATPPTTNAEYRQEYCPPIESLIHNAIMVWSGPGGWKSSSTSLIKSVDTFIGAQWIGVTLGEVICLYIKKGRDAFPVSLQREILILNPNGGNWSEDKGGYKDCTSQDVKQCQFMARMPPKPKKPQELYEELNFYKGQPVKDN